MYSVTPSIIDYYPVHSFLLEPERDFDLSEERPGARLGFLYPDSKASRSEHPGSHPGRLLRRIRRPCKHRVKEYHQMLLVA